MATYLSIAKINHEKLRKKCLTNSSVNEDFYKLWPYICNRENLWEEIYFDFLHRNITDSTVNNWSSYTTIAIHLGSQADVLEDFKKFLNLREVHQEEILQICNGITIKLYLHGMYSLAEEFETCARTEIQKISNLTFEILNDNCYFRAIGHICSLEWLIRAQRISNFSLSTVRILDVAPTEINSVIKSLMVKKCKDFKIEVVSDGIALGQSYMEVLPSLRDGWIPTRRAINALFDETKKLFPHGVLNYPRDIEDTANKFLQEFGFSPDSPIFGLHLRGKKHWEKNSRDADSHTFDQIIEYIHSVGGISIFMNGPKNQLEVSNGEQTFCFRQRKVRHIKEILEVHAYAKSVVFIGSLSGGTHPASLFGTRTLWVNFYPIIHFRPPNPSDVLVPKRLYSHKLGRELSLDEIFHPDNHNAQVESVFSLEEHGYSLIDNSPEIITVALKNMINRNSTNDQIFVEQSITQELWGTRGQETGAKIVDVFNWTQDNLRN